jgi:hypothetical protein
MPPFSKQRPRRTAVEWWQISEQQKGQVAVVKPRAPLVSSAHVHPDLFLCHAPQLLFVVVVAAA